MIRSLRWKLYDIRQGIKNIAYFWRTIWKFRPYDYGHQLHLWQASLRPLRDAIANGNEDDATRMKKVAKIQRCIDLLDRMMEDDYIGLAEQELGITIEILDIATEQRMNKYRRIFELANKLEQSDWKEFFNILQGQSYAEFEMLRDKSNSKKTDYELYEKWFDGSGMKGWWD